MNARPLVAALASLCFAVVPACSSSDSTSATSDAGADGFNPFPAADSGTNRCASIKADTTLTPGTAALGAGTWKSPAGVSVDLAALKYVCGVTYDGSSGVELQVLLAAKPEYCQLLAAGLHDESIARLALRVLTPWNGSADDPTLVMVVVPTYARATNTSLPGWQQMCNFAAADLEMADKASDAGAPVPAMHVQLDPAKKTLSGSISLTTNGGAQTISGTFSGAPVFAGSNYTAQMCCDAK